MQLHSILTSTNVGDVALAQRPELSPSDSVAKAIESMRSVSHGCALVCDGRGRLVGILTERDVMRRLAEGCPDDEPLEEAMTFQPGTIERTATLLDAIRAMVAGGYRRLPVLDDEGRPTGLLDVKTIVHFLVENFPEAVYNQTSHRHSVARTPEGA